MERRRIRWTMLSPQAIVTPSNKLWLVTYPISNNLRKINQISINSLMKLSKQMIEWWLQLHSNLNMKRWNMYQRVELSYLVNHKTKGKFYCWIVKKCNFRSYLLKIKLQTLLKNMFQKISYLNNLNKCWLRIFSTKILTLHTISCSSLLSTTKQFFYVVGWIIVLIIFQSRHFCLKFLL